jgi:DNA-binding GntR family transcriptional regulator
MSLRGDTESATRRAYEWTRSRILDGTFAGGALLSEGQVATAVEVSRTPVREAFLQLAAEHMLELYPKRGALVVPVSTADLREVLIARRVVEPWAAATVAQRVDRAGVVSILRDRLAAMTTIKDDRALLEADREFHQCLLAAAENQLLSDFYSTLRDRQIRGGVLALQHRRSRAVEALDEHAAIIDALERGDAEVASELATAHVEATAIELGLASLS